MDWKSDNSKLFLFLVEIDEKILKGMKEERKLKNFHFT